MTATVADPLDLGLDPDPAPAAVDPERPTALFAQERLLAVSGYVAETFQHYATPARFAERFSVGKPGGTWRSAPHLEYISDRIALSLLGFGPRRLIFNVPPQHGKTMILSQYTPAWILNLMPALRILLASYQHGYAREYGRRVRNLIAAHPHQLGVHLAPDSTKADDWNTTAGGGMMTAGLGGAFIGRRADILLCDDLIKGTAEAHSRLYRDKVWEFLRGNALTRLAPGAVAVLVITRWHQDDPIARLRQLQKDEPNAPRWQEINLPVRALDNDPLGRPPGALLWPEQYNEQWAIEKEAEVGPYNWLAQYMQDPTDPAGAIFRRDFWLDRNRYDPRQLPPIVAHVVSVDTNSKEGDGNARTAIVVGSITARPYRLLIRYAWAQNLDFLLQTPQIETVAHRFHDGRLKRLIIEDESSGAAVMSTIRATSGPWLRSKVEAYNPRGKGDKPQRARAAATWANNGSVLLPEHDDPEDPWLTDYEEELYNAGQGAGFMDMVDATSQLVDYVKDYLEAGLQQRLRGQVA